MRKEKKEEGLLLMKRVEGESVFCCNREKMKEERARHMKLKGENSVLRGLACVYLIITSVFYYSYASALVPF